MYNFGRLDFPNQHVSYAEKQEVDWYAKCCDYVIEAGIACKADFNVEEKFNILLGNIPREYYQYWHHGSYRYSASHHPRHKHAASPDRVA